MGASGALQEISRSSRRVPEGLSLGLRSFWEPQGVSEALQGVTWDFRGNLEVSWAFQRVPGGLRGISDGLRGFKKFKERLRESY